MQQLYGVQKMSKKGKLPVTELFGPTIQGEGMMTGTLSHFVRTGGCGLRCSWCDSLGSVLPDEVKKNSQWVTPSEIIQAIQKLRPAPWVTLTGGDPCMHKGLEDVVVGLGLQGIYTAVETQGQLFPEWLRMVDQLTFSPKGPSSGNVVDVEPLVSWLYDSPAKPTCIKIVIHSTDDLTYAGEVWEIMKGISYDQFWLSAATDTELVHPHDRERLTLMGYRDLSDMVLNRSAEIGNYLPEGMLRDPRLHVGCQQHVLIWPAHKEYV